MPQLSDKLVKTIQPDTKPIFVSDYTGGLTLMVQARRRDGGAAKTYLWRGRINKVTRKITIGRAETMKLADARAKALEISNEVRRGNDPHAAKKVAKITKGVASAPAMTVFHAWELYMAAEGSKRRTAADKDRVFKKEVASVFGSHLLHELTIDDLAKVVGEKAQRFPIAGNRLTALLKRFFRWCVREGRGLTGLGIDPMDAVWKPSEASPKRERVLSEEELRWFFTAVRELQARPSGATQRWAHGLEVLLRTGQRKMEIMGLNDSEITSDVVTLPKERMKGKREHHVVLAPQCLALLTQVHRPKAGGNSVFQSLGQHDGNVKRVRAHMEKRAALEDKTIERWTVHDLRRTFTTRISDITKDDGEPMVNNDTVDAIIAHADEGALAHYNFAKKIAIKRRAMKIWNDYLDGFLPSV